MAFQLLIDEVTHQSIEPIRELLELARAFCRATSVDRARGEIGDAEPNRNDYHHCGSDQVERAHCDADDRAHAASPHPAADPAVHRADELTHVFLNRDPRLPAAHGNGNFQVAPYRGPAS